MTDLSKNEYKIEFPQPRKTLKKFSEEYFVEQSLIMAKRIEDFKYLEDSNDLRKNYEKFMSDADEFLLMFREMILDITDAMKYYRDIKEYVQRLARVSKRYENKSDKFMKEMQDRGIDILNPMNTVKDYEEEIHEKTSELNRRKKNLEEVEQEIAITADMLEKRKSEMEIALRSRYTLTEKQKQVLLKEKDMILDGIEEWGSIYGAVSHNPAIQSKPATIHMYTQLFPEFGQAIAVSKQLFRDRLDGIALERALEGTENPQFGKGEYIGDYKIKDNKLLMEIMKAKVPEQYNKKAVETVKNQQINNMHIISFAGINEEDQGYKKDVGVVLDVDETGKVQRIMQEDKMREFYEKKEGAEIIEPKEKE